MRNIIPFLIVWCCLIGAIFFACTDRFDNQLQTDPEVEGQEIFNASYVLDEHLYYLTMDFDDFQLASNDSLQLPGCPLINIEEEGRKVTLTFTNQECPDGNPRRGAFEISFKDDSLPTSLLYQDYQVLQNTLEGSRTFLKDSILISETSEDILIFDAFGSSTRINLHLTHELTFRSDTLNEIITSGEASGRNLAGRTFSMQVVDPKIQKQECWQAGIKMPAIGSESWGVERQTGTTVRHQILYGDQGDCDNQAEVVLNNGQKLLMTAAD
ncbi:hypothetical protein [Litoribacter populi]|uniref:hypothetical protein n=1 Tax=Litoribacter populi TaxID=2598460 RepID=UPI0011800DE5|nr:hypothetical protein [Litoribacter populi]